MALYLTPCRFCPECTTCALRAATVAAFACSPVPITRATIVCERNQTRWHRGQRANVAVRMSNGARAAGWHWTSLPATVIETLKDGRVLVVVDADCRGGLMPPKDTSHATFGTMPATPPKAHGYIRVRQNRMTPRDEADNTVCSTCNASPTTAEDCKNYHTHMQIHADTNQWCTTLRENISRFGAVMRAERKAMHAIDLLRLMANGDVARHRSDDDAGTLVNLQWEIEQFLRRHPSRET